MSGTWVEARRQADEVMSRSHLFSAPPLNAGEVLGTEMYAWVAERSAVAMYLIAPDGRFVWANPAAARLFGRSRQDLLGCTLSDVSHHDDIGWSRDMLAAALERDASSYRISKRYVRPDGEPIVADVTVTPLLCEGGSATLGFFASAVDDTERIRAEERADASDELLRLSMDSLLDPWVLMEAVRDEGGAIVDFQYVEANREAFRRNGLDRDELVGARLLTLFPGHRGVLFDMYAHVVETGIPLVLDDHPFDLDGTTKWFDNRAVKVGADGLSFTWRDVTESHQLRSTLAHMANTDPLTSLNNRFGLEQAIERLRREDRRATTGISVLYLDLDGLTTINNLYGHPAGDRVLRAVADRIASAVRTSDIVARVGGDEFVIVAPGTDYEGVALLADKVRIYVSHPVQIGVQQITPAISIGTCSGRTGDEIDELISRADTRLIRLKAARRQ